MRSAVGVLASESTERIAWEHMLFVSSDLAWVGVMMPNATNVAAALLSKHKTDGKGDVCLIFMPDTSQMPCQKQFRYRASAQKLCNAILFVKYYYSNSVSGQIIPLNTRIFGLRCCLCSCEMCILRCGIALRCRFKAFPP